MPSRIARALAALAALCIVGVGLSAGSGTALAAGATPTFTDVPASYWAAADIGRLAAQGILLGTAPGRFDPDGSLTRAQFATMLARVAKAPVTTVGPAFADVAPGAWYAPGVAAATGLGWMAGTSTATFAPDAVVNRAMAAAAVVNYEGMAHVAADLAGAALPYADAAAVPAYAHGSVAVAGHLGLMVGSGGRFLPDQPLSRAQAATLIIRLEGVTIAQLQAEGDKVATYVHVFTDAGALSPGGATGATAYAHDANGYVVPADFAWTGGGDALAPAAGSKYKGQAQVTAPGPTDATVTATVKGTKVSASATVHVEQAATLEASAIPPAVLATATLSLPVRVLTASGADDAAADGTLMTATATPVAGGAAVTATATLRHGSATAALPPLPPGAYTLQLAAAGLPPLAFTLTSVTAPQGALQLGAQTPTSVPAGVSTVAVSQQLTLSGRVALAVAATQPLPPGDWPLQVTVSGSQAALPTLTGESHPTPTLKVAASAARLPAGGSGPVAVIGGNATGSGTVTVSVPGGALTAATLPLQVTPTGLFGGAATPGTTTAGHTVRVAVQLLQSGGRPAAGSAGGVPVYCEPIDPAGHPLPWMQATVGGGTATVTFTPVRSGRWTFRWYAHGYTPVASGSLTVAPGAATRLVIDPTPTSILLPGQKAKIGAWEADAYGNAVGAPAHLNVTVASAGAPAGSLAVAAPGTVATFTAATTPGETTITFTAAGLPPATVTFRTVATRADRIAGKGGWVLFPEWKADGTATLLARAKAEGDTHLYLEVATTNDGFYGGRALDDFLYQAHAAGLAVIAWVYAGLEDPASDTLVMRQVATYTTPTGDHADGIALDLEEVMTPDVLAAYTAAADAAEGPQGLTIAVPYPPQYGPPTPFSAIAPNVQVIAPMDYWHIIEGDYTYDYVYHWVADSVRIIRRRADAPNMPVEVVAQTYDAFAGGSGRGIYSPTPFEVAAAMRAAKDAGAIGVSFYRPSTATAAERAVMSQGW